MENVRKSLKILEENEELKNLKLKCTSLDGKLTSGLKTIKEMQAKINETMNLQIMPQGQGAEEEKKEEQLNKFMEDTVEKLSTFKTALQTTIKDFNNLSNNLDSRLSQFPNLDNLVELESKQ
jgi:hypothetical protein